MVSNSKVAQPDCASAACNSKLAPSTRPSTAHFGSLNVPKLAAVVSVGAVLWSGDGNKLETQGANAAGGSPDAKRNIGRQGSHAPKAKLTHNGAEVDLELRLAEPSGSKGSGWDLARLWGDSDREQSKPHSKNSPRRLDVTSLNVSKDGLELIKRSEGLRLEAYQDSAGVFTIGYGHTKDVQFGMQITRAEAERLLVQDLGWAVGAVKNAVGAPLKQCEFDALVSLCFNIGANAFSNSTLVRRLNQLDYDGAASEFARWCKITIEGEKVESVGLKRRRNEEAALFMGRR